MLIYPKARGAAALLLSLAIVSTVAACDPIYPEDSPLRIQQQGSSFRLVICEQADIEKVLVEERGVSDESWTQIWLAEGTISIVRGQILDSDTIPDGLNATEWTGSTGARGDSIAVSLAGPGPVLRAKFVIPSGGLPSGEWLTTGGSIVSGACDSPG